MHEAVVLLREFVADSGSEPPAQDALLLALEHAAGWTDVLLAMAGGYPAGVAVLSYHLNTSIAAEIASIEDTYVRPTCRRQGVGRALMAAIEKRCTERGISYVEVQVEGEEAAGFYSSCGYRVEPGVRIFSTSLPL